MQSMRPLMEDDFQGIALPLLAVSMIAFAVIITAAYSANKLLEHDKVPVRLPTTRFKFFKTLKNRNAKRFEKLEKDIEEMQALENPSEISLALIELKKKCDKFEKKYLCPIGRFIMSDPVTMSSGITFERNEIAGWLSEAKKTRRCPITRKILLEKTLPATASIIKSNIQEKLNKYEMQLNKIKMALPIKSLCIAAP